VIGKRDPICKSIETFDTNKKELFEIEKYAWNLMDLSVKGIIEKFDLKRPIYKNTAKYGHFGHDGYPWEEISK
jgi:S-adenosylmethionine synthetase